MRVSVLSYSFRGLLMAGKMDIFGYLETCKYRYGLSAADIWNGFLVSTDDDYIQKIRDGLDERDLELADLCVDHAYVWDDDESVRLHNHHNAVAALRAGRILGAGFVRIDAGSRAENWTEEQFEYIVKRYREYCRMAWDHGFKMGAENHWGPEKSWANLKKLYEAVNHPGFGLSIHLGGWSGTDEEKAQADHEVAPWVSHTHFPWNVTEGPLEDRMAALRDAGYSGYYSVEHHSTKNEYAEVAVQISRVRNVLEQWREG